ncbi:hypothetical protein O53_5087 [Microcystis aeruginosa TAIHU98]|nr:hypothetical protein BH695_3202 [Microcystis aeruginosa PCC 7806SL]ELP52192.1 hypothetical protein O53_5087 [Microcystis aeruginosa TAIHU98]ELS45233.1 hypothetical protein C789_4997 [Microcystis aeruginosa FACHB-905 = DIANCHI905]
MLPYQGGQGGSNPKSIFNLIITSYLAYLKDEVGNFPFGESVVDSKLGYTASL